jgi:hypothetical protein
MSTSTQGFKDRPDYPIGLKVIITKDCRPRYKRILGRDLSGRRGVIAEYAVVSDSQFLTDMHIPMIRVGRHLIGGFECWWVEEK